MLVRDLNDSEEALRELAARVKRIGPDEVYINLPSRPPAEAWVSPPEEDGLMRAKAILGNVAHIVHSAEGIFDFSGYSSIDDAITGVITRHPMREEELLHTLKVWPVAEVRGALTDLESRGSARSIIRYGDRFWTAAAGRYGETQAKKPRNKFGTNQ